MDEAMVLVTAVSPHCPLWQCLLMSLFKGQWQILPFPRQGMTRKVLANTNKVPVVLGLLLFHPKSFA